jgi:hypothetical protein
MLCYRTIAMLAVAAGAATVSPQVQDVKNEMKKLQGTWNVVSVSMDGGSR